MNKAQAKKIACWESAEVLQTLMAEGWPFENEDLKGLPQSEKDRIESGLLELIDELSRRSQFSD